VLVGGKDVSCELGQEWLLTTVTVDVLNVASTVNPLDSDRVPPTSKLFSDDPTCSAITRCLCSACRKNRSGRNFELITTFHLLLRWQYAASTLRLFSVPLAVLRKTNICKHTYIYKSCLTQFTCGDIKRGLHVSTIYNHEVWSISTCANDSNYCAL
jgi:hypothetical protein